MLYVLVTVPSCDVITIGTVIVDFSVSNLMFCFDFFITPPNFIYFSFDILIVDFRC